MSPELRKTYVNWQNAVRDGKTLATMRALRIAYQRGLAAEGLPPLRLPTESTSAVLTPDSAPIAADAPDAASQIDFSPGSALGIAAGAAGAFFLYRYLRSR